ncbi:unnamed protein product [Peronospora farinosa]|uniref:Uncharacterized protein n=1 Tax=Peronospora farinosa TaxID=134698 RepID=A0AAV0SSK6_9STRA|nr:unnamed protein product [Peronospora farinosa]CAI5705020.1 unnamed protein product [Peronospora farinosa]
MRMLTMNSILEDSERRRQDDTSHVLRSPLANHNENDDDDDVVHELEHVPDGFPSPPARVRPRRRFVNSGQTTYELSFSRRPANGRRRAEGEAAAVKVQSNGQDEYRPIPAVSSLSSVLSEVMTGKTKALNNIIDTTLPQPNVTYKVEQAADGTLYVAASDGNKYFANSTIGQIFLKSASNHNGSKEYRGEFDNRRPDGSQQQQQQLSTRQADCVGIENMTTMSKFSTDVSDKKSDGDVKKTVLGYKEFQSGMRKEEKKESMTDLKTLQEQNRCTGAADLGSTDANAHQASNTLEPTKHVSQKKKIRGDTSWIVRPANSDAQEPELSEPTEVVLLDSNDMQTAHQAKPDLLTGLATATNDSEVSDSGPHVGSSTSSTDLIGAPTKTPTQLQPKKDLPSALDAYDEDDNPLCRSFQNVRNVDSTQSMSDELEDDQEDEHGHDEEHENAATTANDDSLDVNSPVLSSAINVAAFVGGFKGQLVRRSGASGLVNRKRAVRHARLTVEEQKAADIARKIREARSRIPFEFRDENMSPAAKDELQKKKIRLARGRRVDFNPDVLCREFEVESEDEDDGYDSPDEIVDAVQLVSKRDVFRAEDVVAAFPMEQPELPSEEMAGAIIYGNEADSPVNAEGYQSMRNDPLTFSQLNNDKRLSFSDL